MVQPRDLPELRYEIIDWMRSETAHLIWRSAVKASEGLPFMMGEPVPTDDAEINAAASALIGAEVLKLESADLFYVSTAMTDLAVVAGHTLPEFDLASEDLPSRAGLMVFGKCPDPSVGPDFGGLHAVSWGPHPAYPRSPVVIGAAYYDRTQAAPAINARTERRNAWREPALIYAHGYDFLWKFGTGKQNVTNGDWNTFQATVRSAWLLMQQTIARTTDVSAPRPVVRRLAQHGRVPAKVRIIELRRHESTAIAGTGMSEREYHHQWVVRGHWRQQACGPGRTERRPTWITPHIKGPEGAPILGGEKVYALKR